MANAFLVGGGSGSGIRQKPITSVEYEALSEADKKNPYVIWIITDKTATNMGGVKVENIKHKACTFQVYQQLSEDDRMDPNTVWIITDKDAKELQALGLFSDESQGSKLYNIAAELDSAQITKTLNSLVEQVNTIQQTLMTLASVLNKDSEGES